MKILQFDIIEGFKKDGIMAFEGDNKSESYLITLLKNKRRYTLSDKTVKMIMLNKETKEGDFFEIEIINPERGEIKIDVTDKLTKEDGRFVCQLVIDGAGGFKENSVLFYVSIKKSLVNEISGEIIADPSFKILTDALVKVDEWSKYFEETSGKIEEKYAERLNEINSQLSENTNKVNDLDNKKATKTEVEVERKRIDLLTKIESGETEGNTELLDIRVGADGNTYDTAGRAIREQFTQIENLTVDELELTETIPIPSNEIEKTANVYPYSDGIGHGVSMVPKDNRFTFKANVIEGHTYTFDCSYMNGIYTAGYIFADENNNALLVYYDESLNSWVDNGQITIKAPTGSKYLYINRRSDSLSLNEIKTGKSKRFKAYTKEETYSRNEIDTKTQEINARIDNITTPAIKPTILFLFDNGGYDNRAELLKQYGFKGTFNINNTSGSLTVNSSKFIEVKNLIKEGHDIGVYCGYGNDTITNPPLVGEGSENWYQFIKNATDVFESLGIYYPTLYGCRGLKASKSLVEACEKLGFTYVSCYIQYVNSTNNSDSTNIWYNVSKNSPYSNIICPFSMYDSGVTFETIKTQIDNAIENNYILPLFTHDVKEVGDSLNVSTEIFTKVLQYVKTLSDENKIDVLTYRQLFNKYNVEKGKEMDYTRIMTALVDRV